MECRQILTLIDTGELGVSGLEDGVLLLHLLEFSAFVLIRCIDDCTLRIHRQTFEGSNADL